MVAAAAVVAFGVVDDYLKKKMTVISIVAVVASAVGILTLSLIQPLVSSVVSPLVARLYSVYCLVSVIYAL